MAADTPVRVNGALYDGSSWSINLPGYLEVEQLIRQALSISFPFARTGVEQRKGRSEFSNGTNRGKFFPEQITVAMPVEAWIPLMPLLAQRSPDRKSFGKAQFDFSVTLKKTDDTVGSEIKFFNSRWLGPSNPNWASDATMLQVDCNVAVTMIEWDGYNP